MKNLIFDWNNVNQYGAYSGIYVSQPQSFVVVSIHGQLYLVSIADLELTGMKDITDISTFELKTILDITSPIRSTTSSITIASDMFLDFIPKKNVDKDLLLEVESLLRVSDLYKNIDTAITLELTSSYEIEQYLKNVNSKVKLELEGLFEYFYQKDVYNFVVVESESSLIIVPKRTSAGFTEFELNTFLTFISTTPFSGILVYGTMREDLRLKGIYKTDKTIIIRVPDFKDPIKED